MSTWSGAVWTGIDRGVQTNARELTEQAVAMIDLELGLVDERLFVVLTLTTLVTTAMGGVLLPVTDRRHLALTGARCICVRYAGRHVRVVVCQ